jgi:hypothetical protein
VALKLANVFCEFWWSPEKDPESLRNGIVPPKSRVAGPPVAKV